MSEPGAHVETLGEGSGGIQKPCSVAVEDGVSACFAPSISRALCGAGAGMRGRTGSVVSKPRLALAVQRAPISLAEIKDAAAP